MQMRVPYREIIGVPMIRNDSMIGVVSRLRKNVAVIACTGLESAVAALYGVADLGDLQKETAPIIRMNGNRFRIEQDECVVCCLIRPELALGYTAEGFVHEPCKVFDGFSSGFSGHAV